MALEEITSGSTVADLDVSNPDPATSQVSAGALHIQAIKKAVQFTFMNVSATVSSVAAELDFAHKGGTVSGNAVIKGSLDVSATAEITYANALNEAKILINGATGNISDRLGGGSAWTATQSGVGIYRITHNLFLAGFVHYHVMAVGRGVNFKSAWVSAISANYTTVKVADIDGTAVGSNVYVTISW